MALVARRRLSRLSPPSNASNLTRLVRVEGVTLVAATMIASVLATRRAPSGLQPVTDLLAAHSPEDGYYQAGLAGNLAVYLTVTQTQLQMKVVAPSGTQADGSSIEITGRSPDRTTVSFLSPAVMVLAASAPPKTGCQALTPSG